MLIDFVKQKFQVMVLSYFRENNNLLTYFRQLLFIHLSLLYFFKMPVALLTYLSIRNDLYSSQTVVYIAATADLSFWPLEQKIFFENH